MNILISGVGGDIGLGVCKILRRWGIFDQLHGIDTQVDHIGRFSVDHFKQSPSAYDKKYLHWLEKYINQNSISLFIPTSEAEIKILSDAHISLLSDAKILINNPFIIKTCLDKYETMRFLASHSIAVPFNGLLSQGVPTEYPIIIKPRYGRGSKGILTVNSETEIPIDTTGLIWQEKLEPEDQEYTCAVYCSITSQPRILIMKRKLSGGYTASGEVITDDLIERYLINIINSLNVCGSINLQLRKTKRGPLLFEINPRLSSTVVFRDLLGFTDLRWWISDVCNLERPHYDKVAAGIKFYRGVSEHIIFPEIDHDF